MNHNSLNHNTLSVILTQTNIARFNLVGISNLKNSLVKKYFKKYCLFLDVPLNVKLKIIRIIKIDYF